MVRHPSTFDAGADLPVRIALLERESLVGGQHVAEVGSHGFEDADAREQLEVHADPQQPRRIGEMALLGDDVVDECAGVQRRLVAADREHREPRMVRAPGSATPAAAAWRAVSTTTMRSTTRV